MKINRLNWAPGQVSALLGRQPLPWESKSIESTSVNGPSPSSPGQKSVGEAANNQRLKCNIWCQSAAIVSALVSTAGSLDVSMDRSARSYPPIFVLMLTPETFVCEAPGLTRVQLHPGTLNQAENNKQSKNEGKL